MAKSELRLEAIRLRKEEGLSIRNIATILAISKSSASNWLKDIPLSPDQVSKLQSDQFKGAWKGAIKAAELKRENKRKRFDLAKETAIKDIGTLSDRELKIAGLCLYWAEGCKKSGRIRFCNSDPNMHLFFLAWLKKVYNISKSELSCFVGINEAHKHREHLVMSYWSQITEIPLSSFTKTSFKKYPLKKSYENFNDHYGTLDIRVRKPGKIYAQIISEISVLMAG